VDNTSAEESIQGTGSSLFPASNHNCQFFASKRLVAAEMRSGWVHAPEPWGINAYL
jgi:hypothetical protein